MSQLSRPDTIPATTTASANLFKVFKVKLFASVHLPLYYVFSMAVTSSENSRESNCDFRINAKGGACSFDCATIASRAIINLLHKIVVIYCSRCLNMNIIFCGGASYHSRKIQTLTHTVKLKCFHAINFDPES